MRRYVKRIHDRCTPGTELRIETREPIRREQNQKPENEYQQYLMSEPMQVSRYGSALGDAYMQASSMVFETMAMVTMYWHQEDFRENTSYGYYEIFISYFQVPSGSDLPQLEIQERGQSFYDMDTRPYGGGENYSQWRIAQLESRLRELEEGRMILPREEINNIHQDIRRHFDEQLFEVE